MTQTSFDPIKYADQMGLAMHDAAKIAKKERDLELRRIKKRDPSAYGWRLTGQLRQYAGFGQPDGRVRTVYYITHSGV